MLKSNLTLSSVKILSSPHLASEHLTTFLDAPISELPREAHNETSQNWTQKVWDDVFQGVKTSYSFFITIGEKVIVLRKFLPRLVVAAAAVVAVVVVVVVSVVAVAAAATAAIKWSEEWSILMSQKLVFELLRKNIQTLNCLATLVFH